ncbi:MAG: FAD:protein FMN transferase [Burkholderiaceae bacterium]
MRRWLTPFLVVLAIAGCRNAGEHQVLHLAGQTMGTAYNIIAIGPGLERESLSNAVEASLAAVNASLSNWDPDSEVARFSASERTDPVEISAALTTVMGAARDVHAQSAGRFDVTLGPLIDLWGFGPRRPADPQPSDSAIRQALQLVGQERLLTLNSAAMTLTKSRAGVGVNLSAIAKGFGVDAVAQALHKAGVQNYMVEIGGDLVTRGVNKQGEPWRIGIEKPVSGASTVQLVVPVSNRGLATSGDYRNFFEADGVRYSHILDPTTGRPVAHRTSSVTVVAENAMLADAWATAMLVLGEQAGLELANAADLAVYFISRDASGAQDTYITVQSNAFSELMAAQ